MCIRDSDNAYNLLVLKTKLTKRNYTVICASNGNEALNTIRTIVSKEEPCTSPSCRIIHLIIMDIDMPILDGLDATREIKSMAARKEIRDIPIVGCSAFDSSQDVQEALKVGMSDYISKPLSEAKLDEVLERFRTPVSYTHLTLPTIYSV
eukprot:TRINITY_DN23884_c0_g1_i1.p1 TRINITY_DN23884_c0_g1~~TRINITY_DN23884_c0_g1_i1.p1  ORF type:complete len:150 (-),score=24.01 TRINITY_DN23884_c0_g1_i1:33-482(-)